MSTNVEQAEVLGNFFLSVVTVEELPVRLSCLNLITLWSNSWFLMNNLF